MKTFRSDLEKFHQKLVNKEHFTFSKYADGEWAVMKNHPVNNKEFWFTPNSMIDEIKRNKLIESFRFKHPNYYVGISCPCCQGMDVHREMLSYSKQQDGKLTWANLWVNSNYPYFVENIIPLFNERPVVLFCNKNGQTDNLPFKPVVVFPVNNNAWEKNWSLIEDAKLIFSDPKWIDCIVLFCCGPFGNILAYELTKHNDKNTYLDIGSTLNPWLKSAGFERHYYMGDNVFSRMTCNWSTHEKV
jgi:hypothetical protein